MDFVDEQEKLLEPVKYYKDELAGKYLERITSVFENLLNRSNIDVEANRKSVKEYNGNLDAKSKNESKLKWLGRLSMVIGIGIAYLILSEFINVQHLRDLMAKKESIKEIGIRTTWMGLLLITLLYINLKYIRDKKRNLNDTIVHLATILKEKKEECYSQVEPLLNLFDDNMSNDVITELIPTLTLDKDFKLDRYANLVTNFGMPAKLNDNLSVTDIISGEILGNPFIISKKVRNRVVDQEYTGSLTVSWTEYYTENGERKSRTVTETLVASIIRPKQIFESTINLIYGNDAAEHLTFTREPQFIHKLKPRKLEKYSKKLQKDVKKMSEKAIQKGTGFLEMGNLEFDALFGAFDRDNEVEFRVLFTPIAQRNMVELLKDTDFGDDFSYYKINKLNNVSNDRDWPLNIERSYYRDFSYDRISEKFFDINKKYFSNFYRLFLPILTIPIYHQHKSQDYIYGNEFNYNYNPYTSEMMANLLGDRVFAHPETTTQSILKTNTIGTKDDVDLVQVVANSYKEVTRTEYIPKYAGDGKRYYVPVDWIDYVPLTATGKMELKRINMREKEFEDSIDNGFIESTENKRFAYKNNIFAIFNDTDEVKCDKILKRIMKG